MIWAILFAALPYCSDEGSSNCAWDAGHSGNGVGTSFYDQRGTAYYADGSTMTPDGITHLPDGEAFRE